MTHKICPTPGCPAIIATTARRCQRCAQHHEHQRGTRAQRGYGREHDTLRRHWATTMADTTTPPPTCPRCGHPITPDQTWDLGHTDDRTGWTGPEHTHCNRAAGGRAAHARPAT